MTYRDLCNALHAKYGNTPIPYPTFKREVAERTTSLPATLATIRAMSEMDMVEWRGQSLVVREAL